MKKLLLFFALAWPSFGAVFSYAQSANAVSATSAAFGSNNTAGNLIVAVLINYAQTMASSVTDSQGNTYTTAPLDTSTGQNGQIQTWIAVGIKAGANTVTFNGASSSNNVVIIAEYTVPASYLVVSLPKNLALNLSSWTIQFPAVLGGSPTLPSEVMLIPIFYDFQTFHTWSLSSGTVRQLVDQPGGASCLLGDYDATSPSGIVSTVLSQSSGTGDWIGSSVVLLSLAGGGGGSSPVGFVAQ
jgi:hypothetical protein